MRILLDVMGGDSPPEELIRGGVAAAHETNVDILFAGNLQTIRAVLARIHEQEGSHFSILPTTQTITMADPPVQAVRNKRESSLVKGLVALRDKQVDGFVSPGNTGAVVAGSIFTLGRLPGILRPGIAASLPTLSGQEIIVIDVGANVDCAPKHFEGFAMMGASYAAAVKGTHQPRIALLSIGEERGKGNKLNYRAYELLEASSLKFIGNVEGHHLLTERPVDVVVCDGFVGNIYLKAVEGGILAVTALLRRNINASARAKVGAVLMQPVFRVLRDRLSYQQHGGAPLLGVNGIVVIAHGRSDARAIQTAINVARCAATANLNKLITKEMKRANASGS